jgi:sterol desaturase/sphingolipid hydroxylase (fatty acid hydroxylase superfamily)
MWTLTEYWLHRLVFHFDIPGNKIVNTIHFYLHGVHHDHPQDPLRLMMPPGLSIPMGLVFLYAYKIIIPDTWMLFSSGFLAGYLVYDTLHYHFHHHKPLTSYGQMLRENHMRHHFQDGNHGYGVSSPFWDYIFFTAPNQKGKIKVQID